MPPVMGAVAFLMAAFTEIDYGYICLIAFVPRSCITTSATCRAFPVGLMASGNSAQ